MEETYDSLDRATLATWRASKLLGWAAVALGSAVVLHTVFDELNRRIRVPGWYFTLNQRPLPEFGTWQSIAPSYGYRGFVAIVIGVLIGAIAGSKLWKAPVKAAAVIAGAYVLISTLVLEHGYNMIRVTTQYGTTTQAGTPRHGLPSGGIEWSYSLLTLLAVPVAALVARMVSRRRNPQPVSPGTLG